MGDLSDNIKFLSAIFENQLHGLINDAGVIRQDQAAGDAARRLNLLLTSGSAAAASLLPGTFVVNPMGTCRDQFHQPLV